jgi:hypothetical protein
MLKIIVLAAVAACSRTPETLQLDLLSPFRAARPVDSLMVRCQRVCPIGQQLSPMEPRTEHIFEDCCYDPEIETEWSICAWNGCGRHETCRAKYVLRWGRAR